MRLSLAHALLASLLCLAAGCSKEQPAAPAPVAPVKTAEESPRLPSSISMGDPQAAPQLAAGFHQIEDGAWRWTQREFAVTLGVPPQAAAGAVVSLRITVPPVVIERLHSTILTASVNGAALAPETYTKAGSYTYRRELAPNLLAGGKVRVDFHLDQAMPPAGADARELGVIVLQASLEPK